MLPAWVAPFVSGPPWSPGETASAPGPLNRNSDESAVPVNPPAARPTITVYVPVGGALTSTWAAENPKLLPTTAPVGLTTRSHGESAEELSASPRLMTT